MPKPYGVRVVFHREHPYGNSYYTVTINGNEVIDFKESAKIVFNDKEIGVIHNGCIKVIKHEITVKNVLKLYINDPVKYPEPRPLYT